MSERSTIWQWINRLFDPDQEERMKRFEERLKRNPARELEVQTIQKIILEREDSEDAALEIVERYFPEQQSRSEPQAERAG